MPMYMRIVLILTITLEAVIAYTGSGWSRIVPVFALVYLVWIYIKMTKRYKQVHEVVAEHERQVAAIWNGPVLTDKNYHYAWCVEEHDADQPCIPPKAS